MKAGTTFLFHVFYSHPDIYFTPEKELHFFAHVDGLSSRLHKPIVGSGLRESLRRPNGPGRVLSPDFRRHRLSTVMHNRFSKLRNAEKVRDIVCWYADRYLIDPVDDNWFDGVYAEAGNRYAADFSNYNALLGPVGWDHVKRLTCELKVIYVMREPVARMWSHVKFHLIQSGRSEALKNLDQQTLNGMLRTGAISAHARYGDIVESLKSNLDSSQLKIVFFEDFIDRFPESAAEIEYFLGISHHAYDAIDKNKKVNTTENIAIPEFAVQMIRSAVAPQISKLRDLGVEVPQNYF